MSWNTKNVKPTQVPQSWAELWDMQRFAGQRGFWKQPFQTMEIALLADGVAKDKLYPIDVERALKSLDRIKSQIFWWTSGGQSAQILIDGDIAAGMTWNGRVMDPKLAGAPVDLDFDQALFVADAWVVPRGTKNQQAAMDFIAFTLQAAPQAEFSKAIHRPGQPQGAGAARQAAARGAAVVRRESPKGRVPGTSTGGRRTARRPASGSIAGS